MNLTTQSALQASIAACAIAAALASGACTPPASSSAATAADASTFAGDTAVTNAKPASATTPVKFSDEELHKRLTPEQYYVTQQKGTERAFTGKYWNFKEQGAYVCSVCGTKLFSSDAKFDSGCGWPSFFQPSQGAAITEHVDTTLGMTRTEVTCSHCGAHLGHVFDDGPAPTGQRYCINSASIVHEKDLPKNAPAPTPKP